ALTARLLALCRRADKGLGDRITTVRRAAVMLGLEAVQAAVLSVQVYELMQRVARRPGDDPAAPHAIPFDRAGFWRYSIGVACAAELIAEATAPARRGRPAPGAPLTHSPGEHFVVGLLHGV